MDKKSTFIIAGILIAGVLVFVFISFQKSTMDTKISDETASTTAWENAPAIPEIEITSKTVVTAKHAYRSSVHTVVGEIPLPTPCHILEAKSVVSTNKKEVLIKLVSSVKTGEVCEAVVTPARFKVTATAEKTAVITATLNGQAVTLNLIEAGVNEDLDNFDLYIKG